MKIKIEHIILLALYILSFFHTTLLIGVWLCLSVYLCFRYGADGAVKSLVLIAIRSVINPGVAVTVDSVSMIKWGFLFSLSVFIFLRKKTTFDKHLVRFLILLLTYCLYLIVSSFITGSYPVISLFKVVSWAFIFFAIIYAIWDEDSERWSSFLFYIMSLMVIMSIFFLPTRIGFLRNGRGFQGLINHPNLFGLLCAFCFSLSLAQKNVGRIQKLIIMSLCCLCAVLSQSRASVFSIFIVVAFFIFTSKLHPADKLMSLFVACILFGGLYLVLILNDPSRSGSVFKFVYKGHMENILYSRSGQVEKFSEDFKAHPILGCGFMTDYLEGFRSMKLSFSIQFEPGNLVLFLLAHTGVLGTVFFLIFYGNMFYSVPYDRRLLFFTPFLISMAEMILFSSNSIAIVYYVIFGTCFKPELAAKEREDKARNNHQGYRSLYEKRFIPD